MLNFDYGWGQRAYEQSRQRQAQWAKRRAENQLNQARNASRQQAYPNQFPRQSTANRKYNDEIPEALIRNLDETRGHPNLAMLLTVDPGQINHWIKIWSETTSVGKEVAAEWQLAADLQAAKQRAQQQEREERERLKKEAARLIRDRQELYRLPPGTVVRVRKPRTLYDGCIGRTVGEMRWQWNKLQALVEIDPAPVGHPIRNRDPRYRPPEFRLITEFLDAEMLQREHPEALG